MVERSITVLLTTAALLAGPGAAAPSRGQPAAPADRCEATPLGDPFATAGWNGWGADLVNSRFQPAAAASLTPGDVPRLALKWALGFPDGEFAAGQPTVVGGRVYVGAGPAAVYSFDANTGCRHWRFPTHHIVRASITIARLPGPPARYVAVFGDLQANLYVVDAETGTNVWTKRVDFHPHARITGAPKVHDGRIYVPMSSLEEAARGGRTYECCTFRGKVVAYEAATGQEIWRSYTLDQEAVRTRVDSTGRQQWGPAGGAVWNSPTIDARRGALYIGTGNAYVAPAPATTDAVMALDLKTGARLWVNQLTPDDHWVRGCGNPSSGKPSVKSPDCPDEQGPDFDFGQSPILRDLPDGRSLLVVGQKSGMGWALDPDRMGALAWEHRVGRGSIRGGMLFGSAADDQVVYFGVSDFDHGPEEAGGLAAVRIATGERLWYVRPPKLPCQSTFDRRCIQGQAAAITAIPGVVFSGATNGILRAYSAADGRVLWEHDTDQAYATVNGLPARGGMLYGPGPVVAGGVVYMSAGYGETQGGVPGNVLLAFAVPPQP
ncbi:MAG: cytochrome C oxidase Cbb3 [Acidimicrobiia bacterium]|nr:cytochrome C oxidase Cbb3 [Acidimicrobiia bacterium]